MRKKRLLLTIFILSLAALTLASCSSGTAGDSNTISPNDALANYEENNQAAHEPEQSEPILPEPEPNEPTANAPNEPLNIQIDFATDEFLSTFENLHHFDFGSYQGQGATLVVWSNQPLTDFAVVMLSPDFLDDDAWGFEPISTHGLVSEMRPSEAFVIENYMGLGTLPHSGVTFTDEEGVKRYFFMLENQGYPETGDRWLIREIEADRIIS